MEILQASPESPKALIDLRHPAAEYLRDLHRETVLRDLLDPVTEVNGKQYGYANYERAVENGLIDAFDYDPATGDDAIVHILQGDIRHKDGAIEVAGFHHKDSSRSEDTAATTDISKIRSNKRAEYDQHPYNPYAVNKVMIKGFAKVVLHKDEQTGQITANDSKSSMFPREYDAFSVLQTIRMARDEALARASNHPDEEVLKDGRENTIVTIGFAPMLDGETKMPVKLILDKQTKKIKTALPLTKRGGHMKMTANEINEHLGLSK